MATAQILAALVMLALVPPAGQALRRLEIDGPFVEPISGIAFPEHILGWTRTKVDQLPAPGGHMIEYELARGEALRTWVSGYVYPHVSGMPESLDDHLQITASGILSASPRWRVLSTTNERAPGPRGPVTRSEVIFLTGWEMAEGNPLASALYLQKQEGFWIKWRTSTLSPTINPAGERVRALFDAIVGPEGGLPASSERLHLVTQ